MALSLREALREAYRKLVGREPAPQELDNLVDAYNQAAGPPTQKAKESLRRYAKVQGYSPSDDNLDRIIHDIEDSLKDK